MIDKKEALKAYWKDKAKEFTRGIDIPQDPICDVCNKNLDKFPDDCYYFVIGNRMKCGVCTEASLTMWEENDKDPNFFGRGEVENAIAHWSKRGIL